MTFAGAPSALSTRYLVAGILICEPCKRITMKHVLQPQGMCHLNHENIHLFTMDTPISDKMKPTPKASTIASTTASIEPRKRAEKTAGTTRLLAVTKKCFLSLLLS